MVLQDEEKQLNRETRRVLKDLFNEYRFRSTNEDLIQLDVFRQKNS